MTKKTYLCLGAGPGIALSTAIRFAKEGFQVIMASRNREKQGRIARAFEEFTGKKPQMEIVDVGNADQIMSLAASIPDIDVLHFNAAIIHAQTLQEAKWHDLENDIRVGITGALFALKAFAPAMLERQSGSILLTGGTLAINPLPQYLTLGIAKSGIRNLAECIFDQFRESHVHVATVTVGTAVEPGSKKAADIADLFWRLHDQPTDRWTWEATYGMKGSSVPGHS